MEKEQIQRIPLREIHTTGRNAREKFEIGDLIASIETQGLIQPIIVRKNGKGFELVAGERRFRACQEIAKKGKVSDKAATIAAIVRELDDNQAWEIMTVENLQRENLAPLEEAKALAEHVAKFGSDTTADLAEKIGKSAHWVRRHIAVLELPKDLLKMWNESKLSFAHLEQMLRVKDNGSLMKRVWHLIAQQDFTAKQVEKWINENSTNLKAAKFDTKGCAACPNNSQKQFDIFGLGDSTAKCLKIECFHDNTIGALLKEWKGADNKLQKKYGTMFPILEGRGEVAEEFTQFKPDDKCKACKNLVTVFTLAGAVKHPQACLDRRCLYNRNYEAQKSKTAKSNQASKAKAAVKAGQPDAPRCDWHGKLYREKFYLEKLPEAIAKIGPNDLKVAHMTLYALYKAHHAPKHAVLGYLKTVNVDKEVEALSDEELFDKISKLTLDQAREGIKQASAWVVMTWDDRNGFDTIVRDVVAQHFDLKVERDFIISEEYLQAKTRKEIVAFIKQLPRDKFKQINDFMLRSNPKDSLENKKKDELIKIVMKSGADLKGCVPAEVASYVKSAFVPTNKRPDYDEKKATREKTAQEFEKWRENHAAQRAAEDKKAEAPAPQAKAA